MLITGTKKIDKSIYDRAKENHGSIRDDDYSEVFSVWEVDGYGIYGTEVFEKNGEYFVRYKTSDSCD